MNWLSRFATKNRARRWRPAVEQLERRLVPAVAPTAPVYAVTFEDARTDDNAFSALDGNRYWTVDAGADQYQVDLYERPTSQTYQVQRAVGGGERFAASEYYANLDIVRARAGFDDRFLYVSIELAGRDRRTSDGKDTLEGLVYRYGFSLANESDGGHGYLVVSDQPALKNSPATTYGQVGTFVYRDANGDVGGTGLDVTKQDRQREVNGNGYEQVVASDGRANGTGIVWVRISPTNANVVEFAVNYGALGFTQSDLRQLPSLDFEANKGLQDPANYRWNDEYTKSEAGSPYRAASGDLSKSEFGTQGLGNIYELDTLRGGAIVDVPTLPSLPSTSLSGFVYLDLNRNGVRDQGDEPEPGLAGVTLVLTGTDTQGNAVTFTTVTDSNGFYRFDSLPPGTYAVDETQPSGYADGAESVGQVNGVPNGSVLDNDLIGGIVLGAGQEGLFYNFGEVLVSSDL